MKKLLVLILALVTLIGMALPAGVVSAAEFCPPLPAGPVPVYFGGYSPYPVTSYFKITVSGAGDLNGAYEGWCIDTHHSSAAYLPNIMATLICSYDSGATSLVNKPENLDLVNWILNHDPRGTNAGGPLGIYTWLDVQMAFWQLLETPPPPYDDIGADTARVAALIAMANAPGNGEGFTPSVGELCAVLVVPTEGGVIKQISLITVRVPSSEQGRWTGGGTIGTGASAPASEVGERVTHGFEFHNDLDEPNNFEVNWGGNHFHMTKLLSARCWKTELPDPPVAPVSEVTGIGTGKYNGVEGYTINFHLHDYGEPGVKDYAEITITGPEGVVLQVAGLLIKGNQQAHRDNK